MCKRGETNKLQNNKLNFCLLLLFTDISPACHILWNNRDRLSGIKLSDSSVQLLRDWPHRIMSSFDSFLSRAFMSRGELREIYAAVDISHYNLRHFAEMLLLTGHSVAVDLLKEYCKYRV